MRTSKKTIRKRNSRIKAILLIFAFIIISGFIAVQLQAKKKTTETQNIMPSIENQAQSGSNEQSKTSPETYPAPGSVQASLFVPYWMVSNLSSSEPNLPDGLNYENTEYLMYFGITPTESGSINISEPGYVQLQNFASKTANTSSKRLLTVRMIQEEITSPILEDTQAQDVLIAESLELVNEYDFDGIILDLEHSVLPTQETIDAITQFSARFSQATRTQNHTFTMALYGDTLYRQRPYNLAQLEPHIDTAFIMAYDFHKSYGEPGPNFPLSQGDAYNYSLTTMAQSFSELIPPEKLVITFGMFGYDWSVDDEDRPAKSASPLTLNQAQSRYYPQCELDSCTVERDTTSNEVNVRYIDETGQKHNIWFEDTQSLYQKVAMLYSKKLYRIGFWAFGYY